MFNLLNEFKKLAKTAPVVGETYSVVLNGREDFCGEVTSVRPVVGRGNLVRVEDTHGDYMLYWDSDVEFVSPNDAPKNRMKTEEERAKEIYQQW